MTEFKLPKLRNIEEVFAIAAWCEENFGPSKTNARHQWIGGRWFINGTWSVQFTHKKDAVLFSLRWL